jgi:hypothetical protein
MKLLLVAASVAAGALVFDGAAHAALSADQRCSACLYTYAAIDREMTNQTNLHKNKKLADQKTAVRGILSSICDDPKHFGDIGFANGRYVKLDELGLGPDVDRSPRHAADLAAACKRLVNDNEKKLVAPLADFRKHSRADVSKNLCTKWTDSCSFDYAKTGAAGKDATGKAAKTKISKSNKCLIDAIGLVVQSDFDGALEKVSCATLEMPDEKAEADEDGTDKAKDDEPADEKSQDDAKKADDSSSGGGSKGDDDELTVDDEDDE